MGEEVEKLVELAAALKRGDWGAWDDDWLIGKFAEAAAIIERVERERDEAREEADRRTREVELTFGVQKRLNTQVEALTRERDEWQSKFDKLWREHGSELGEALGDAVGEEHRRLEAEAQVEAMREALTDVRGAIMEHAPDTLWVSLIETAVDRIDAALANSTPESSARVDLGKIRPGDEVLIRARVDTREGPLFSPIQHIALNVGGSLFTAKASLIAAHLPAPAEARSEQAEGDHV